MAKNKSLSVARNAKRDEFYTQLTDIEKQLRHYRQHFRNKTVLCNCDDPFESNFFKYFVLNFNRLGIKKLIATCYTTSPILGSKLQYSYEENGQMSFTFGDEVVAKGNKIPYKAIVTQVYDKNGDGGVDMLDVAELFKSHENVLIELNGDGDFRSLECLELLKESDVVVTNPPFSLFRDYIDVLIKYKKDFVIIGPQNAITYKEIFPLILQNKLWLGYPFEKGDAYFHIPEGVDTSQYATGVYDPETKRVHFRNCCWYTNMDIKKRHEEMILVKYYDDSYCMYENLKSAINVDRLQNIPCDYAGIMGVPITFLDKYNPDQFEIVGCADANVLPDGWKGAPKHFIDLYYSQGNTGQYQEGNRLACYITKDGIAKIPYKRVLIKNKHPEQSKGGRH
ncbi:MULTISPECIES: adenine-specific methyltransferase EcoRI family protein [Catenibacterium]|uniref:adenine-specific methyltransferase EcoRI family protein n=1 Tax=Catenibacterium TaxID=135858 RepID=UPI002418AF2D|nr:MULTISPECIES: adenine-specific methyltransferase EcoRI family protein [Catenibacterium]MDO5355405.1 adenine-specific methyltransferase EcoRI family protein [Catenibacterium sp.]